jgi:hypothetical protein
MFDGLGMLACWSMALMLSTASPAESTELGSKGKQQWTAAEVPAPSGREQKRRATLFLRHTYAIFCALQSKTTRDLTLRRAYLLLVAVRKDSDGEKVPKADEGAWLWAIGY